MPVVAVVDTNCDPDVIDVRDPGQRRRHPVGHPDVPGGRRRGGRGPLGRPAPPAAQAAGDPGRPAHRAGPVAPAAAGRARRGGTGGAARPGERRARRRAVTAGRRGSRPPAPSGAAPAGDTTGRSPAGDAPPADSPAGAPTGRQFGRPRGGGLIMAFTAKDVQALRQATGVGMLDAKRALEENDGDMDEATQWLRVQGLAGAAKRADREASQGAVAVVREGSVAAIVELRCETDFVAKSAEFVSLADELAVAGGGQGRAGGLRASGRDRPPAHDPEGEHLAGPGSSLRGDRGRGARHLPPPAGRPGGQRGARPPAAAAGRTWRTTSPCTSPSPSRPTCGARTCPRPRLRPSGRRSKRSAATRASPRPPCPRSSRGG